MSRIDWQEIDAECRAAVARLVGSPRFELIPNNKALAEVGYLPEGADLSITASPSRGIEPTIDLAVELAGRGFSVTPHIAARSIRDRAHLDDTLMRLSGAEISSIFVIGGDGEPDGVYADALALLGDLLQRSDEFTQIGIGGYPEGHPLIRRECLWEALVEKAPHASYVTTQMTFDAGHLEKFAAGMRERGVDLPIVIGVPGVADRLRLLRVAATIGVGDSLRFLSKRRGLITRFATRDGYRPDHLLHGLACTLAAQAASFVGLHIFTFNECRLTEAWRSRLLSKIAM